MSFWDGTQWVGDEPAPTPESSRLATWLATLIMVAGLTITIVPFSPVAAASHHGSDPPCTINPSTAAVGETYVVSVSGLPTGTAINLWVTEDGVTTGSPLGSTPDGTFNLNESSQTPGVTTYTFSGPTKKNMTIYGTCSVSAY